MASKLHSCSHGAQASPARVSVTSRGACRPSLELFSCPGTTLPVFQPICGCMHIFACFNQHFLTIGRESISSSAGAKTMIEGMTLKR